MPMNGNFVYSAEPRFFTRCIPLLRVSTDAVHVHQSTWLKMLKEKPFS